jgi:magnesium transporter
MPKLPSEAAVQAAAAAQAAAIAPANPTPAGSGIASAADASSEFPPLVRLGILERDVYSELEGAAALAELPKAFARRTARIWIDISDGDAPTKTKVAQILGLHPLLVEDITERDQRAKLEEVGDLLHVVLFSLGFDDSAIFERELDFVLGPRFLLTNHSHWWDPRAVRLLRAGPAESLGKGTDHLLWTLADEVIDSYFPILDLLGDELDGLEDQVVAKADKGLLERLFELKRELIQIRRVTSPEREMFNILSSRDMKVISAESRLYYRDAYDHLIRLTDEIDTYRELASATLEAYLSTVNNNLSLIMKRLTGVTVVVAGVGAIGGLFGMSEAQTAFRFEEGPGFWIVVAFSLLIAGASAAVLRKIDWI